MSLNVDATNRDYIDQLYQQYQADPSSVDGEWRIFFQGFELGYGRSEAEASIGEDAWSRSSPAAEPAQQISVALGERRAGQTMSPELRS